MADLRVLLCDDDPDLLGLLTRRLEKMGLEYDVANDGREAKSLIEKNEYDAIVADIYMPEATGLEVMQFAQQRDPDIQVVIITSSATLDNAIDALNHGAFGYLTKPFDHLIVFDNMVSRAVEYRHLLGANQHKAEAQKRRGDMLEDEVAERIAQLHKKQKGLLDLLATLPDGILVVEEGGKVVISSPVGERWLARDRKSEHQPIHAFIAQVNSQVAERSAKARVEDHDLQLITVDFPADGDMRRKAVIIREIEADGIGAGSLVTETVIGIKKGLATLYQEGIGTKVVLNLANQFAVLEQLAGWSPAERKIATGSVLQSPPVTHAADEPIEPGVRSAPASIADSSPTTQGAVDPINNEGSDALKSLEEPQGPKLNTAELAEALRAAAQLGAEPVQAEPAVQMEIAPEPMPEVQTEPVSQAPSPASVEPRPEPEPAAKPQPTTVPEPTFPKTQPSVLDPAAKPVDSRLFRPRIIPEAMSAKLGEPPPIQPTNGQRRPIQIQASAADTQIFRRVLEKMSGETVIGPGNPEPQPLANERPPIQPRNGNSLADRSAERGPVPELPTTTPEEPESETAAEQPVEPVLLSERIAVPPVEKPEPRRKSATAAAPGWPPTLPSEDPEWDDNLDLHA